MNDEVGIILLIKILFNMARVVFICAVIVGTIELISTRKYNKRKH
jgi:hypothetical protein